MKRIVTAMAAALTCAGLYAQKMNIATVGDTAVITITNPTKYLILPVEENMPEAQVVLDQGKKTDTWMDVRLAVNGVDYEVPFALNKGNKAVVKIANLAKNALALQKIAPQRHLECNKYGLLPSGISPHACLWLDERCERFDL